jgi:hypothetical protein
MKFCRHGHLWNDVNTRWAARGATTYKQCRACANHRHNLKYRRDAAFREAIKAKNLARYHASKGELRVT